MTLVTRGNRELSYTSRCDEAVSQQHKIHFPLRSRIYLPEPRRRLLSGILRAGHERRKSFDDNVIKLSASQASTNRRDRQRNADSKCNFLLLTPCQPDRGTARKKSFDHIGQLARFGGHRTGISPGISEHITNAGDKRLPAAAARPSRGSAPQLYYPNLKPKSERPNPTRYSVLSWRITMKKKLFLVISAMLVFGLAVYAFNSNTLSGTAAMSCCSCCSGDSCPMKDKKADASATHEACDCCGDSCPMKDKKASAIAGTTATREACDCCGDSCPMKKGDAATTSMNAKHADMKMEGMESCPMMKGNADHKMSHDMKMSADGKTPSCACCAHAKEKKDAPAV